MPCTPFGSKESGIVGFVCHNRVGRLHVGNRYIWVSYHRYCGPSFYTDTAMQNEYEPLDDDPMWQVFDTWLKKFERNK